MAGNTQAPIPNQTGALPADVLPLLVRDEVQAEVDYDVVDGIEVPVRIRWCRDQRHYAVFTIDDDEPAGAE